MAKKTYPEKLMHPFWQKKRLEIMDRDGWACLRCKSTNETLHVHHIDYIYGRDPWDYPDSNFETICKICHAKEHGKEEQQFKEPDYTLLGEIVKPPEVIVLMDQQLASLENKLTENISDELQEEILKNIMFLKSKRKELLNQ